MIEPATLSSPEFWTIADGLKFFVAAMLTVPLLVSVPPTVLALMLTNPRFVIDPANERIPSDVGPGLTVSVPLLLIELFTVRLLLALSDERMSVPLFVHGAPPVSVSELDVPNVATGATVTVVLPGMFPLIVPPF